MAEDHLLTEMELAEALRTLLDWEVRDNWLRRTYHTPGWPHTMLLANTIGYVAEAAGHHPDLSIGYAQVTVKLRTHRVLGITPNASTYSAVWASKKSSRWNGGQSSCRTKCLSRQWRDKNSSSNRGFCGLLEKFSGLSTASTCAGR